MTEAQYVPGVCNIGPAETNRRLRIGWTYLFTTLLGLATLLFLQVNPLWRLLLVIPASVSASGFLQARWHFCFGFAVTGVFNFGSIGQINRILDQAARQMDLRMAVKILVYSGLAGGVFTLLTLLL